MVTNLLPHDNDLERVVLGTIIGDRNALDEVRELLTPDIFYSLFHQDVYKAILAIDSRGDRPDILMVTQELLKTKGQEFKPYELAELAGCFSYDLYMHTCVIVNKARRRKFIEIAHFLIENSHSEIIDTEDVISETGKMLESIIINSRSTISNLREAIQGVYDQINSNLASENKLTGDPTGFRQLDEKSGGLQKSDLIIIAADTSMGKTSLAINMIMNSGAKVAFYSMEMKKEQIAARMIAIQSGIPASKIMYSHLSNFELQAIDKGVHKIAGLPIYFDDRSTSNIDMILTSIRRMKIKHQITGVVIDYLQILSVNIKGSNKEQQMGEAARRLKNLAKELDIWIIALSQLNRDHANHVPTLNRLRDSGQIAEAADIVMLIYRPEVYGKTYPAPFTGAQTKDTAMIDVAKGRNIGLLKMLVNFSADTTRFCQRQHIPRLVESSEEPEPF